MLSTVMPPAIHHPDVPQALKWIKEPALQLRLINACWPTWTSDWGKVDIYELPEPHRSSLAAARIERIMFIARVNGGDTRIAAWTTVRLEGER
jgi:hypothetical protein